MRPKPVRYSLLGSPVNTKQRTRHSDSSPSFSGTWKNNFVFPASGCQLPTCQLQRKCFQPSRLKVTQLLTALTLFALLEQPHTLPGLFLLLPLNSLKSHVFFHKTYLREHHPSVNNKALPGLIGRFQANKNSHFINPYYLHLSP